MTFLWIQKQLSDGFKFVNRINYRGLMQHQRKKVQWRSVMSADIALWPQARHGLVLEMSIKDLLSFTGLRARSSQSRAAPQGRRSWETQGTTPQTWAGLWWQEPHPGEMECEMQLYPVSSSRRAAWDKLSWGRFGGTSREGSACPASARAAGGWAGLRDTSNTIQAWTPEHNLKQSSRTRPESVDTGARWGSSG